MSMEEEWLNLRQMLGIQMSLLLICSLMSQCKLLAISKDLCFRDCL